MILRIEKVAKLFGGFAALRDASAEFDAGKLYLITGENGAGKSTLLRMIAGLLPPSRGSVVWASEPVGDPGAEAPDSLGDGNAALKGRSSTTADNVKGRSSASTNADSISAELGYMAHATMLYDELSGMENLRYFGKLYGIGEAACEAAMRTVGLDPGLRRPVVNYSQGMRQRLALARAILHSPSILLLDEPFSNLDAGSARHMVEVLASQRDGGMCVILVTHQPSLLLGTADVHFHISGGVMRQEPVRAGAEVAR